MKPKPSEPERGIECPKCGCHHFEVLYTRPIIGQIKRVRACRHCGRRMVTFERAPMADSKPSLPRKKHYTGVLPPRRNP